MLAAFEARFGLNVKIFRELQAPDCSCREPFRHSPRTTGGWKGSQRT